MTRYLFFANRLAHYACSRCLTEFNFSRTKTSDVFFWLTKDAKGNPITIVADGTMQEVGLPNRSIAGTWIQTSGGKTVKDDFRIRRQ
jgi:hypothetical protein